MLSNSWAVAALAVGIAMLAFKNFLKSRNDSSAKYLGALSTQMNAFYHWNCQTPQIYEKKVRIRDSLHLLLLRDYPSEFKLWISTGKPVEHSTSVHMIVKFVSSGAGYHCPL